MRLAFWSIALLFSCKLSAQTLFTYGNNTVEAKEFLRAYTKNNNGVKTKQSLQDYLDLYIASRLKVKEAQARGYDTLPQLLSEMDNLRNQILPMYDKDTETMNRLINEAFSRSQKDIHLAHIFIGFANSTGGVDSAAASKKASEALAKLKSGTSFTEVAKQYSDDPSAKTNGGDLGYITVFSLPYELENLAYQTHSGQVSNLYRSKAGYHIFKNLNERKALGRIKAAQILLAFPPEPDAAQQRAVKKLADSLYNRILKGDDFGKLAAKFSNDNISGPAEGLIPEFGVGQYDPAFESTIVSLKNGGISKPFQTAHGYHIVKRIGITPVSTKLDEKGKLLLKERIELNDRSEISKKVLIDKVIAGGAYKRVPFNDVELWEFTDSLFTSKTPGVPVRLTQNSALFTIGMDTAIISDWVSFAQVARYKNDGTGFKPYTQVWDEFVKETALDYYKNHLEDFNAGFREQMQEFKEGNLFFEIMQREIWGPAQTDTIALKNYFEKNKEKYAWKNSVNGVIFYAADIATAQKLAAQIRSKPSTWHDLVAGLSDKVTADSGRFEIAQIPHNGALVVKANTVTAPVLNKSDNTASFAYVQSVYTKPALRNFEEAKGLVINDYQNEVEQKWIADLKKKYPVTVNQQVWEQVQQSAIK